MKTKFTSLFMTFICIALFTPSILWADWVLYDDFSTSTLDTNKWFRQNVHPDVTWAVSNGKLLVTKKAGTSAPDWDSRLTLINMPATANGIKVDAKIISMSNGHATFDYKFACKSGTFDFGSGAVNIKRQSAIRFRNVGLDNQKIYSGVDTSFYEANDDSNEIYTVETTTYYNGDENTDSFTGSIIHNANKTCSELVSNNTGKKTNYCTPFTNTDVISDIYSCLRIRKADPATTFVIEIDNVYVHTGNIEETESSQNSTKMIIIPLFNSVKKCRPHRRN